MTEGGAFIRFNRDKRGYEHFYLVQHARRGKSRARILYWFRTPPNVKVGREPFDEAVRQSIEARYPDITFDWKALLDIHIPPAEVEHWRERRRLERAERAAGKTRVAEVEPEGELEQQEDEAAETAAGQDSRPAPDATPSAVGQDVSPGLQQTHPKKRRRRRRGHRHKGAVGAAAPAEPGGPASNSPDADEGGDA